MKNFKFLTLLFLMFFFVNCAKETVGEWETTVTVSLVNNSDNPCYIWAGHSTTPEGNLIPSGGSSANTVYLKGEIYTLESSFGDELTYYIADDLKISVADENEEVLKTKKDYFKINVTIYPNVSFRATWDGENISIQSIKE